MGGGMISKSLGCPAVPYGVHKKIIDVIKGGSCFYINRPDIWYARTSPILNASFDFMTELNNIGLDKDALKPTSVDSNNQRFPVFFRNTNKIRKYILSEGLSLQDNPLCFINISYHYHLLQTNQATNWQRRQ